MKHRKRRTRFSGPHNRRWRRWQKFLGRKAANACPLGCVPAQRCTLSYRNECGEWERLDGLVELSADDNVKANDCYEGLDFSDLTVTFDVTVEARYETYFQMFGHPLAEEIMRVEAPPRMQGN